MSFIPRFKILASNGITLIYTLPVVQSTNAPLSSRKIITLESNRGNGEIVIDGGCGSWDLEVRGILIGVNYEDLTAKIEEMETKILPDVPYYLTIDKTPTTTFSYKVKRITPIEYSPSFRVYKQDYTIRFRTNTWE